MQSLLSSGAGFAPGAPQQLLEQLGQQQFLQHTGGGRGLGMSQGTGGGLEQAASVFAAMRERMGAGEVHQPQVMAQLMAQMHAVSAVSGGPFWGHNLSNGMHVEDEMEEDEVHGEQIRNGMDGYHQAGRMESDDDCLEQSIEGAQNRYSAVEGVGGALRKLDKADVKKAKRGVYITLREAIDQDMAEPSGKRMQEIIKELRKVQRTERPAGNKEWVGCDACEKWRKVPRGFQFDRSKDFFCNMIPKITCETKEEPWEEDNNDASFITDEWVLFSWDRIRKELVREKNKFESALKLAKGPILDPNASRDPAALLPLHHHHEISPMPSAIPDQAQPGRRTSEEQSASTESTSAELSEPNAVAGFEGSSHAALATGLDASGHRLLEHSRNSLVAAATASAAEAEKAAQFVKTYTDNISKWVVDENVEAKDKTGRWYRSTVRGVSYTGRQVKINFGGWDPKWDEWIRVKDRRVRDIQCPEAKAIKVDGTPIWPKSRKKEGAGDAAADEMEEEMEMEEVESTAPAKLTREEQRNLDRMRRLEEEERRRRKKEKREQDGPSPYRMFVREEATRLMKEEKGLKMIEAQKMAREEWKKRTGVQKETTMGIIIGSAHQLYACLDEETLQVVAEKLMVDAEKLHKMNVAVYPGIKMKDKLMEGTLLKLPLRKGSGDSTREVKVLCKVQAVKYILTFAMKESETIKALKKRVYAKEDIKIKEQTAVFGNQRLDDAHTLADYNIQDEALVVIQVGSYMEPAESSNDIKEIEYDSRWMLSPAGKRFLNSKEGQAWLKTKAGLEWLKQKNHDEREEIKEKKEAEREKKREENEPGAALKKFNAWFKIEVGRVRNLHPHLTQKEAADAARWSWKVYAGPSTYKHRAEFAKMPSVVSWNTQNLNRKPEEADHSNEDDSAGAAADNEQAVRSKKRRDLEGSEQIAKMIKSNAFSTSYDWSYREHHLSRTAKKAARISLTTDTIEMMTCGLEGLDDRYDGSGWTTWKKKDDGQKKKFNKDGTEKRPRKTQARQPKPLGDPLALPKAGGGNIPRWFRGVPRCPDLLLPTEEDVGKPRLPEGGVDAATAGCGSLSCGADAVAATVDGANAQGTGPEAKVEPGADSSGLTREEKKVLAQIEIIKKQEQRAADKKATGGSMVVKDEDKQVDLRSTPDPAGNPDGGEIPCPHTQNSEQSFATGGGTQPVAALAVENPEQPPNTGRPDASEKASKQADIEANGEAGGAGAAASGEEAAGDAAASAGGRCLLPVPTSAQLAASNLALEDAPPQFFRLPYMAARYKFQKDFEDYACSDPKSEFPTPFVPINKNEYVDEETAYRLPVHEGKNICQCIFVPGTPETACGEQSNCLLRDIYIECGDRCPSGSHCLNKRIKKRQWAKCSIFLASDGRGWALRNDVDLVTGQLVMEYIGEVITGEEVDLRMEEYKGKRHTYLLKLNHEEFIDSTRKANLARFINHCCEPNCVMQKWNVGGVQRVGLFAKYPIPAGSELTFDYDMEFYGSEDVKCLCGAPNCRGTLGKKDDSEKGKSKAATAVRKAGTCAKNAAKAKLDASGAPGAGCGKQGPGVGRKAKAGSRQAGDASECGCGAGEKRKEPEGAAEEDEFFSSLSEREKRKQMEKLKAMTRNVAK